MKIAVNFLLIGMVMISMGFSPYSWSAPVNNSHYLAKQSSANKVKDAKHAAKLVKSKYGGKILSSKKKGKSNYKVKVLKDNGHIVSVYVNAKTGKIKD